ncbi:MAG: MBL fold metallo-hydrolase [Clostridia bacterium]|nr:MBL fold metallo-hydrolase [Clostridia bacterium]
MKITFLGTSHGITEADRFTSSALITVGEKNYLIDAGAPIMKLLQVYGVKFNTLSDIFITHSHGDHYLGLVEFVNQMESFKQFEGVSVKIHGPELFPYEAMRTFLFGGGDLHSHALGGNRHETSDSASRISFERYSEGEIFNDGTLRVTAFKTKHFADSHSLLVEAEGKRVLFTGDMRHDLLDFPYAALEQTADLIVMEGAHQKLATEPITKILRNINARRMVINHIYEGFNPPEAIKTFADAVSDKFPVTAAYDGYSIEI